MLNVDQYIQILRYITSSASDKRTGNNIIYLIEEIVMCNFNIFFF
jgi:hypothetical protein